MSLVQQKYFFDLSQKVFSVLQKQESLICSLEAESSQFIRFNHGKLRQIGSIAESNFSMKLFFQKGEDVRSTTTSISLSGDKEQDEAKAIVELSKLQKDCPSLPVDPYAVLPQNNGNSEKIRQAQLLDPDKAAEAILKNVADIDFTGLYSAGTMIRANTNSLGQQHWFQTENFVVDYSVYQGEQAVKGLFSGTDWDQSLYDQEIESAKEKMEAMKKAPKKIDRGNYRAYLAPSAVLELLELSCWYSFSEAQIRQGDSCIIHMRSGEKSLSPLFHLEEDFRPGQVPQFNGEGELAPEQLQIVVEGQLKNSLISARSAKEYNLASNQAGSSEKLRSPSVQTGSLAKTDILQALDTGLYLSDLHYLNWSDSPKGRITGMTRFACFWVENGKIVAPIENLRFDDSIFRLLGSQLEAITDFKELKAERGSYGFRTIGAYSMPGMLIKDMQFTL